LPAFLGLETVSWEYVSDYNLALSSKRVPGDLFLQKKVAQRWRCSVNSTAAVIQRNILGEGRLSGNLVRQVRDHGRDNYLLP